MTEREKEIFACTELLTKTILDRQWCVGAAVTIKIEVKTSDQLTISLSMEIGA